MIIHDEYQSNLQNGLVYITKYLSHVLDNYHPLLC